jgi:hypothetical protein
MPETTPFPQPRPRQSRARHVELAGCERGALCGRAPSRNVEFSLLQGLRMGRPAYRVKPVGSASFGLTRAVAGDDHRNRRPRPTPTDVRSRFVRGVKATSHGRPAVSLARCPVGEVTRPVVRLAPN